MSEGEAAMLHLGAVLYMLADLHPDYRCDAFEQALRFYNDANQAKIQPSGLGLDHLLSEENLRTRNESALAAVARERDEMIAAYNNSAELALTYMGQRDAAMAALRRILDYKEVGLYGFRRIAKEALAALDATTADIPEPSLVEIVEWFNYWLAEPISERERVIINETISALKHLEDVQRIVQRRASLAHSTTTPTRPKKYFDVQPPGDDP